jgi:hypothetical protein
METLYIEGLAPHGGPQPCVDDPRGRGEALAWVCVGRALEPRNDWIGVPTLSKRWKAALSAALCASCRRAPRGQRTRACTESSCARTGIAHHPPVQLIAGRAALGTLRRYA